MRIIESKDGAIIELSVKPRQNSFRIGFNGDELVVHCTEEPVKGKVNNELLKELSRFFKREARLVSGSASKQKLVLVVGASKSDIAQVLSNVQSGSKS
jgi:uncharacterized protein (TIGR00251 family)